MNASPRRRLLLVVAGALAAGYFLNDLVDEHALTPTTIFFLDGACGAVGGTSCLTLRDDFTWLLPLVLGTLLGGVVWLAAARSAATWVLRPLHDLVPVLAQAGPQNLGHRIRAGSRAGSRGVDDEFLRLCRAVDAMMDRIMAAYDHQRRFAANASHELRTPLAVQRTLIEVGMAQPLTEEQVRLLTAQLLQTNERNERLVEGLLVLSEADQGLAVRTPQRLDEIVSAVAAAHRSRALAAGLRLTVKLHARTVEGERVLLERLVTNLVQNAVKYNTDGGSVAVTVGAGNPALTVTNTGPPVPPDQVDALFEPFKRLAGDRIDHSGGAGLGLAIARSITRAHDGTITAIAQDDGGLRVEVRLPATK
ncbi:HAMP domain-containing sensor histidine kinase [Dactylosporangium sp. AC04546]|uniref:sensor histidine kinase n=1 Tax=Dactylosporangium sp. AC04546 TaxID=2862460 RepID=UPI001EDD0E3F|nr:HAMP domain-containing sensor histidine kinase [Dactylosporangium sp. AC04546]WVK79656.1 HAMP domain-containing sensor histidine kinase [Dactylosporangium sp. AC04546]